MLTLLKIISVLLSDSLTHLNLISDFSHGQFVLAANDVMCNIFFNRLFKKHAFSPSYHFAHFALMERESGAPTIGC